MRYVESNSMKRTLVVATAIFFSMACNKPNAPKLEGRWRGIKTTGIDAQQVGTANLFASTMELEFKGDVVSIHTGSDKQSAKFKVISDEKKSVVITTDQDGPDDKQTFMFVDDKTIDWSVTPGKTIEFAKE